MAYINFSRMERVLARADELAAGPNANVVVARLYNEKLRGPAAAFTSATAALKRAEETRRKESGEAVSALVAFEPHYKSARSATAAYLPHVDLPVALGTLSTDTDKEHAIEALHDEIEAHHADAWAADLLAGPFGTLGPQVVRELHEAESSNLALEQARMDRANAYNVAYTVYVQFKRLVRDTYGPTSREYHRIHLRSAAKEEAAGASGATTPPGGAAPASPAPNG